MRTVLTIGTFDVPHVGHAFLLRQCERLGDHVIVGVNSDRFVKFYRGANPLFLYIERAAMMSALGYEIRPNDGSGHDLIEEIKPTVLAIGMDWLTRDYLKQIDTTADELSEWGTVLAYLPVMPMDSREKLSATEIKDRLR